ncbi:guanine nucleotide-binding 3-like [Stylonychia lemnae]|uniref:Guanine nucleotide-binding 3-like n=1 Tax=Stylonychia lemnae TaxID=5949 RepID=A0A078ALS3_STYLE|nr:guanine nucleotide-binding 3-like [Stylonychia lemnae]|eukprot:CDW83179.1 guanine nucleotide-binding 3-like [Stylonychia lemnae]
MPKKYLGYEPKGDVYNQKQRYAIQKQSKDDLKKHRKDAKKMKAMGLQPVKLRKDAGLPNLQPKKKDLVDQIERKQRIDQETKHHLKEIQDKRPQPKDLNQFMKHVQAQQSHYEEVKKLVEEENVDGMVDNDPNTKSMNQSKKAYAKELKKVIEASDVIVEVLDARDPEGCRSHEMEKDVLSQGKKVLLVINKIDLVPPQNARMWQRYMRNEFPCILFKTNRQNQQDHLSMGTSLHKNSMLNNSELIESMVHTSKAIGSENLMNILKNYARVEGGNGKTKQQIIVGVVGFPNVGKSSLINSLKRQRAAPTGNMPGVTKSMQEIQLDKNIILIDSPGVVLATKDQTDSLILRQAIKIEDIADPFRPVEAIISRVDRAELLAYYEIAPFANTDSFLGQIARKKGQLQAGGIANFDQVARSVIRDFLNGKLKYFTAPPQMEGDDEDGDTEMN